jgi:peptidoglycan/LPS O-acetylase OafA/YrhL
LRGIASIFVCAAHAHYAFISPLTGLKDQAYYTASFLAFQSVHVFFVLSGYAITLSMISGVRASGRFQLREYAAARVGRLYPPLLLGVLLGLLVFLMIKGFGWHGAETFRLPGDVYALRSKVSYSIMEALAPLLFINTIVVPDGITMNGALWSLSFEFWMYVMAGLTCALVVNRQWLAGVLLAGCIGFYLHRHGPGTFFFWYLPTWAAGGLMALKAHHHRPRPFAQAFHILLATAIGVFIWLLWKHGTGCLNPASDPQHASLAHALLAFLICSALHFVPASSPVSKTLAVFDWTAGYSFTLYAIHYPLLLLGMSLARPHMIGWGLPATILTTVIIVVAINVIAWQCSRLVENRKLLRPHLRRLLRCGPAPSKP